MLKSKTALFISMLFAAQLAAAGVVIIEKQNPPPIDQSLNGSVILEKGIIVQTNELAGVVILENTPRPDLGVVLHDRKLAGTVILERGGVIMEDLHLAGGLIIDRRGRVNRQSLSA